MTAASCPRATRVPAQTTPNGDDLNNPPYTASMDVTQPSRWGRLRTAGQALVAPVLVLAALTLEEAEEIGRRTRRAWPCLCMTQADLAAALGKTQRRPFNLFASELLCCHLIGNADHCPDFCRLVLLRHVNSPCADRGRWPRAPERSAPCLAHRSGIREPRPATAKRGRSLRCRE